MTDLTLPLIPQNLDPMVRDAFADWLAWAERVGAGLGALFALLWVVQCGW